MNSQQKAFPAIHFPLPLRSSDSGPSNKNWFNFHELAQKKFAFAPLPEKRKIEEFKVFTPVKVNLPVTQPVKEPEQELKPIKQNSTQFSYANTDFETDFNMLVKLCSNRAKANLILNLTKNVVLKFFFGIHIFANALDTHYSVYNILRAIIFKKHKQVDLPKANSSSYNKFFIEEALKQINRIISTRTTLRKNDEKTRFVFKHGFNSLMKIFLKANKLTQTTNNELRFYNYYFGETAVKMGQSLKIFYNPLKKCKLVNEMFKSTGAKYLKILFKSDKFSKHFSRYLQKECFKIYRKEVFRAVNDFFVNIEFKLKVISQDDATIGQVLDGFAERMEDSGILKLPWHINEAEDAFEFFQETIRKYNRY